MFSWQSSFYLQFIIDKYEKEINDEERGKIVRALVSYHSPELLMKFISAKGNPLMLSPTAAYNLYSIIIDYCIDVDYQISSFTLIQIIDYLMKILNIRQIPKLFQKIEPFFFVVFGHTFQEYPNQEVEKIYQSLKGISILPLAFFSISPLSQSINKNHKTQKIITNKNHSIQNQNNINSENKNFIASETFSVLINSTDSYLSSPRLANIWIESLSAIFRSEAKIDFDLLTIYSVCDKISNPKNEGNSNQNFINEMPFYFKAHFFDSLSYFLSPMNSLQIAKTHFFKLSEQISTSCTVEDLSSLIQYSKHLIELLKEHEISSFTIDMISEIIFSSILPHFRKSKKLEETFKEFCDLLDQKKLEDFVNTHFTTSSISAQQYLVSHFPNNDQDIEILFKEPIDFRLLHLYVLSSHSIQLSNANILKYLVHFFEFSNLSDFQYLIPLYKKNPYLFCAKVIQYMSICDNFEKMTFLLSFLMDDIESETHHDECPIVIYSSSGEYDNNSINTTNENLNDSTSIISLDLAFLSVMYKAIQFPNNPKMKCIYCFLDYLRQCKQHSVNTSYSPKTIAQALNQKFDSSSSPSSSSSSQDLTSSIQKSPQSSKNTPKQSKNSPKNNKNSPSTGRSKSFNKSNSERTPIRTPKKSRRLSIDKLSTPQEVTPQKQQQQNQNQQQQLQSNSKQNLNEKHLTLSIPKRRLSDADSPILSQNSPYGGHSPFSPLNSTMQKEINQAKNSFVRQLSSDMFSTPRKTIKRKFKSKYFDVNNHYSQMRSNYNSTNLCFYIKELINSVKFWDESLLSLMYLKIADGNLHFGVLVSFFTKTISVINQIGKIVSTSPKLLKLFFATTLTMNNDFISEIMKYIFFHGDLIQYRIELVLHSFLAAHSIKKIDDTIFELLKIGFSNNYFDLTCSVISSLFYKNLNSLEEDEEDSIINDDCKMTNLNLYGSGYFRKKMIPVVASDPEEVFLIMCQNHDKCDPLVFLDAFRAIYSSCYAKGKYKLSSEKAMKTISHSLVDAVVFYSNTNQNSDIESIFLKKSENVDSEYFQLLKNVFIKELKMKKTKEIGYFICLKRVSLILSFDEMKPLLSRLFLNVCVTQQNKEIQKIIIETLSIVFKTEASPSINQNNIETDDLIRFLDFSDENLSQRIIQDMFDTINFQDELEKESLFLCFRKLSSLHPSALMKARPLIIPQIITTYSYIKNEKKIENNKNSDSESESENEQQPEEVEEINNFNDKFELKFGAVFSMLAESDLVLFFNQLTLSPKCDFFDRIILDLCRCEDKDFQLFACIENEFSELIDQTINFQFIFQILTNYIQYQPNLQKSNVVDLYPDVIASLLFVLFLCVSESFISNNPSILPMLQEPINRLETLISLPLMPLNNFSSFEKIIEIIPLPVFSNEIILHFLSKCLKLHSSKHHQHFEELIEMMIIYFSQNEQVFQRLISIYINPKIGFNHSHFHPKISKILSSSKRLLKLSNSDSSNNKQLLKEIFALSIEKNTFNSALNSVLLINESGCYTEFLLNLDNFKSTIELSSKFFALIQKAVKFDVLNNDSVFFNVFNFVKNDVFNPNSLALNILDICLSQEINDINIENVFKSLFFYFVGKGKIDLYLIFSKSSYKEFSSLKEIKHRELEIMFYIIVNLIGIKDDRIKEILSDFFTNLLDLKLSKEALALSQNIVKQYEENPFTVSFPTISIDSRDNMYHI